MLGMIPLLCLSDLLDMQCRLIHKICEIEKFQKVHKINLKFINIRHEFNCTANNRVYREYYAGKKTNIGVCP